jgi:hypothetical protein
MTEIIRKDILLNTFILIDEISNDFIINSLLKDIYENQKFYYKPTNVIGKHSEFNFFNENKNFHDFLKLIKKQIYSIYQSNFIIDGSWFNIYTIGSYAKPHDHKGTTAFSGILYLTDGPGPGTYFPEYDLTVREKKGKFVLFHGNLKHEVKKFNYKKDRVTIAFNCSQIGFHNEDQKILLIK